MTIENFEAILSVVTAQLNKQIQLNLNHRDPEMCCENCLLSYKNVFRPRSMDIISDLQKAADLARAGGYRFLTFRAELYFIDDTGGPHSTKIKINRSTR